MTYTCNQRYNGVGLNGNRRGTNFTSRTKIRSSHVEIMVFGLVILGLDEEDKEEEEEEDGENRCLTNFRIYR